MVGPEKEGEIDRNFQRFTLRHFKEPGKKREGSKTVIETVLIGRVLTSPAFTVVHN